MPATAINRGKVADSDSAKLEQLLEKVKAGQIVLFQKKKEQAAIHLKKAGLI